MSDNDNFTAFARKLINLSTADNYLAAVGEWELIGETHLYDGGDGVPPEECEHCLCGHAIRHILRMENRTNGNEIDIGNVCINKFMGIDGAGIYNALRLIDDPSRRIQPALANYAYQRGLITEHTRDTVKAHYRKRSVDRMRRIRILHLGEMIPFTVWERMLKAYLKQVINISSETGESNATNT